MTRRALYREFLTQLYGPAMVEAIVKELDHLSRGELDMLVEDRETELRKVRASFAESHKMSIPELKAELGFYRSVRRGMDN